MYLDAFVYENTVEQLLQNLYMNRENLVFRDPAMQGGKLKKGGKVFQITKLKHL